MINFVVFQLGWFSAILGAANQFNLIGMILVLLCCLLNIKLLPHPRLNIRLIFLSVTLGLVLDSLALYLDLISYITTPWWPLQLAPLWILGLWALFATTLNGYLAWINRFPLIGILGGMVFGPLAYLAGLKLGAVVYIASIATWIYLAFAWGIAMMILLKMNRQWSKQLIQSTNLTIPSRLKDKI